MPITIIQWNIHGIFNNYNELTFLIKDLAPILYFSRKHTCHIISRTLSANPKNIQAIKNNERAIRENNLIALNDGSPTHLSTQHLHSHRDLTDIPTDSP